MKLVIQEKDKSKKNLKKINNYVLIINYVFF
jgi:hypothetical protein